MASTKRNIKTGSGADLRSPVYAEMGSLSRKPSGLARHKPIRGEKQRSRGSR
jgi:hypothetical protein